MSRTVRNYGTHKGGDAMNPKGSGKKSRAYVKDKQKGHWKFVPTGGREYVHSGQIKHVSSYDKLVTRNANRSLKKGARQQHKKELKNILNSIV